MSLKLYSHPFASFCWKALIALYEADIPFEPVLVDLGDAASREAFYAIWPIGKMPVLVDEGRGATVPEATVVIEYLAAHFPSAAGLVPTDVELAWKTRLADRFYDFYVSQPMQKIVADSLRPEGDLHGVAEAREQLRKSYAWLDGELPDGSGPPATPSRSPTVPPRRPSSTPTRSNRWATGPPSRSISTG